MIKSFRQFLCFLRQEKLEKLMMELLDKYHPLELHDHEQGCLWPTKTSFFSDNLNNKIFICKNETFDEQGRLIIFYGDTIFCELEKVTAKLIQKYKLLNASFQDGDRSFLTLFSIFSFLDNAKHKHRRLRAIHIWLVNFRRFRRSGITALQPQF